MTFSPRAMMRNVLSALYQFIGEEGRRQTRPSGKGGRELEDKTSKRIYDLVRGYGIKTLSPFSPLEYLSLPGIKHQIDNCMVDGKIIYLIECKSGMHKIDHLYSFNAKIIDHALGFEAIGLGLSIRGIFLSTSEIGYNSRVFAFTYGIIPIDPVVPPLEHIMSKVPEGEPLREKLLRLEQKLTVYMPDLLRSKERRDSAKITREFMHCFQEWKEMGYA